MTFFGKMHQTLLMPATRSAFCITALALLCALSVSGCTKKDTFSTTPPPGTITVLSYPSGQAVYILSSLEALDTQHNPSLFTSKERLAGYTPLQVLRDTRETYSVVVKQSPGDTYRNDGEVNHLYVFPDDKKVFTDAKIYTVAIPTSESRPLVTSFVWPESASTADFMKYLPGQERFAIPKDDLNKIEAAFKKKAIPEAQWEVLLSMLRKTGKAAWYGEKDKTLHIYYQSLGKNGELMELAVSD
jgi:hypothetical protein